ncbi:tapasin-related protein-like [Corythoichthys intestinalis]|uniref:tapasin-related protein-like n=1 Tax=Corythoichthys intestinalis TaxID=161448 RepID=UPI0025A56906|nr:tapasin-related protein-like [Corythoichthys intestinalis]
MGLLKILTLFLLLCAGVKSAHSLSWLPCMFSDFIMVVNNEGTRDVQLQQRPSILQFGQQGDSPVNPHAITFLVIPSKVNLHSFMPDTDVDDLDCAIHRHNTEGVHVKWPSQKSNEYNSWFSISLTHTQGLFTVSGILRYPCEPPSSGQEDVRNWPAIEDRQTLITSVAVILKTLTPTVTSGLGFQKTLHCQFAVDHKTPNLTALWYQQNHGERRTLFSHASRSGQTEGRGVELKNIAGGDLSYTLPFTEVKHAGMYVCSASVFPLSNSLDISLQIKESPQVSLNVGPMLTLQEGEEKKLVCEAAKYYPLDAHIAWYEEDPASSGQRVGAPLPKALDNILLSSHKNNMDRTYSLSGFFYLKASLRQSGRQFTCTVSHTSLRMPIKKSFILIVEEPTSWIFTLTVCSVIVMLLSALFFMLRYLHRASKHSLQKKPY